ncbi:hypothetical protein FGU65_02415 [Methanoculleus sp. FWC-SCC1]|uniref:Uncharacterized protein n=1 Tax=Methanoculleus frigidifontis TaxID=2584085 RepID=A0ABT8M751_9EURY|nr:hypothetical protein [Methanoculleus sp. FWC-SCC1]MDN7023759.1 hypothetical protein [Methanoculleus sp. FWC-SCC1]
MILSDISAVRNTPVGEELLLPGRLPHGDEGFATFRVWDEAGFLPPRVHRCIVDLLHAGIMEDEIDAETVALLVSRCLEACGYEGEYTIRDPARLRRFAAECGIATNRRSDEAVARDVTRAIIGEYGADA